MPKKLGIQPVSFYIQKWIVIDLDENEEWVDM
jgi:hypothetical protein